MIDNRIAPRVPTPARAPALAGVRGEHMSHMARGVMGMDTVLQPGAVAATATIATGHEATATATAMEVAAAVVVAAV